MPASSQSQGSPSIDKAALHSEIAECNLIVNRTNDAIHNWQTLSAGSKTISDHDFFSNLRGLQDSDQKYISGKAALGVRAQLLQDLAAAEATIASRNTSGTSKSRTVLDGGLPYQLFIPSGVDNAGKEWPDEPHSTPFLIPLYSDCAFLTRYAEAAGPALRSPIHVDM